MALIAPALVSTGVINILEPVRLVEETRAVIFELENPSAALGKSEAAVQRKAS